MVDFYKDSLIGYGYYAQLEKIYPNSSKAFFFFFLICLTPKDEDLKSNKMCGKTNSVFSQMIFRSPLLLLCCLITKFCILAITRVPVYFFVFWLCHRACGILVPRPGVEPTSSAVGVCSLNYWTTREPPDNDMFRDSEIL